MSSNDIAIRVQGLSKCYGIYANPRDRLKQFILPRLQRLIGQAPKQYFREFWALKDVSFEIKKGETVGIIGRNGSGKSTLLQMICGTLNPTSGSIQTNGRIAALLELGSGFNPEFTGRENVYLNASVLGLTSAEIDTRFAEIVTFADIGEFIEQPVKTYSSGMAVRLAFAVIAHVDADILVIDEALSVGDAIFTQKCMRFINDFKNHGTILFVSHDIGAISSISSRTVWFSRGQIAFMGETAYVVDRYHQYALQEIAAENKNKEPISEIEIKKINSTLQEDDLGNQINPKSVIVGQGKALIVKAGIFNVTGESVNVFTGNEKIRLTYLIEVKKKISGFLVGFTIKDRLGLKIIEENNSTYNDASDLKVVDACFIRVNFEYRMPYLKAGIYSVDLSIAEGTQESHKPQAWIYDAIQIEFNPIHEVFGMVTTGLISFNLEAVNG